MTRFQNEALYIFFSQISTELQIKITKYSISKHLAMKLIFIVSDRKLAFIREKREYLTQISLDNRVIYTRAVRTLTDHMRGRLSSLSNP